MSDQPGVHDAGLLRGLIDGEARALRFPQPAEPVELSEARTLLRQRTAGPVVSTTLGLFRNTGGDPTLTAEELTTHLPADAPVLRTDTGELVPPGEAVTSGRCVLLTASEPLGDGGGVAVFGWSNALCPALTVEAVEAEAEGLRVSLRPPSDPVASVLYAVRRDGRWQLRRARPDASGRCVLLDVGS